jgi:hypothetical protein
MCSAKEADDLFRSACACTIRSAMTGIDMYQFCVTPEPWLACSDAVFGFCDTKVWSPVVLLRGFAVGVLQKGCSCTAGSVILCGVVGRDLGLDSVGRGVQGGVKQGGGSGYVDRSWDGRGLCDLLNLRGGG